MSRNNPERNGGTAPPPASRTSPRRPSRRRRSASLALAAAPRWMCWDVSTGERVREEEEEEAEDDAARDDASSSSSSSSSAGTMSAASVATAARVVSSFPPPALGSATRRRRGFFPLAGAGFDPLDRAPLADADADAARRAPRVGRTTTTPPPRRDELDAVAGDGAAPARAGRVVNGAAAAKDAIARSAARLRARARRGARAVAAGAPTSGRAIRNECRDCPPRSRLWERSARFGQVAAVSDLSPGPRLARAFSHFQTEAAHLGTSSGATRPPRGKSGDHDPLPGGSPSNVRASPPAPRRRARTPRLDRSLASRGPSTRLGDSTRSRASLTYIVRRPRAPPRAHPSSRPVVAGTSSSTSTRKPCR